MQGYIIDSHSTNQESELTKNNEFNFNEFNEFIEELSQKKICSESQKMIHSDDWNDSDDKHNISHYKKQQWRYCTNCDIETTEHLERKLICPNCGVEIINIDDKSTNYSINRYYNTSATSSVTTIIEGKNSYPYNKSLRSVCSSYKVWNSKKSLNKMNKLSYEAKNDKIPPYINEAVIKQFEEIRKRKTFRGAGQESVKAALVYYMCQKEGLARKPYKIALLHGILERDLSKADSIVRSFHEDGVIELFINKDNYESYIEKYMDILKIDIHKWKYFIVDIIKRAEDKHVYMKTPKPSTKCIGAIYLLVNSVSSLKKKITKEDIISKCKISKTTLINHYQELLHNRNKLKKVYKNYNIKFPKCEN